MHKQNRKETSILKFLRYIHSYAKKRAYNHKFTKLSYVHTNITKLKFNIRHYYVIKKRARAFCFVFFSFCFSTFSTLCLSPTHKMENLKTLKTNKKNKGTIDDSKYLCLFHSLKVYVFCRSCHSVQEN